MFDEAEFDAAIDGDREVGAVCVWRGVVLAGVIEVFAADEDVGIWGEFGISGESKEHAGADEEIGDDEGVCTVIDGDGSDADLGVGCEPAEKVEVNAPVVRDAHAVGVAAIAEDAGINVSARGSEEFGGICLGASDVREGEGACKEE